MKEIGLVTLLSVAVTAAAPNARSNPPASYATLKSTAQFADCFARSQERHGIPWWFIPKERGGTFSDLGAKSVARPYFLVIDDRGTRRDIQLQQGAPEGAQSEAVQQCI
jgi:hypothetical protein